MRIGAGQVAEDSFSGSVHVKDFSVGFGEDVFATVDDGLVGFVAASPPFVFFAFQFRVGWGLIF